MDIDYVITGDFEELSEMMIPVMKESRFLSDKPNVVAFTWYPITEQTQCVELEVTQKASNEEIAFLIRDLTSLSVGVFEEGNLTEIITLEEIMEA